LTRGSALIVIVLASLGLWGVIWLAVALFASVWERLQRLWLFAQ
jgi:hypothetical protein